MVTGGVHICQFEETTMRKALALVILAPQFSHVRRPRLGRCGTIDGVVFASGKQRPDGGGQHAAGGN
jgi:hypothetical protein